MTVLIGLGNAGCNIVNKFSEGYKKITIDAGSELPEFNSPEHYEEKLTDYKHLLDLTKRSVISLFAELVKYQPHHCVY